MDVVVPASALVIPTVIRGHRDECDERNSRVVALLRSGLHDEVGTELQILTYLPGAVLTGRARSDLGEDPSRQAILELRPLGEVCSLELGGSDEPLIRGDIDVGSAIRSLVDLVHGEADTVQSLATVALDVFRVFKSTRRGTFIDRVAELVDGQCTLGVLIHQRGVAGSLVDGSVLSDCSRGSDTQGEASGGGESDRTNGQSVLLHWSEFLYISSDWSA